MDHGGEGIHNYGLEAPGSQIRLLTKLYIVLS